MQSGSFTYRYAIYTLGGAGASLFIVGMLFIRRQPYRNSEVTY